MTEPDAPATEPEGPEPGAEPARPYILIRFKGPGQAGMEIEGDAEESQVFAAAWMLDAWAHELRMAQLAAAAQREAARSRIAIPTPNRAARRHPDA